MKASKHPASEASGKKKQGALSLEKAKWQADPAQHRLLGLRAHDENEEHFPHVSLLVPDEAMGRRWAAERIQSSKHSDCGFRIEKVLLDLTSFHVLSQCGELPDDPLVGPIEWDEAEPYDLGPLWEQRTLEELQRMKDLPPAALEAAKLALVQVQPIYANGEPEAKGEKGKTETKANGKPGAKKPNGKAQSKPEVDSPTAPIGTSHPAPKPGQSAKGKGGAKTAPAKRATPQKLRAASKAKHTKRA